MYHWIFEIPFFSALLDFEIAFESTNHLSLSLSRRPIENNASGGDLYRVFQKHGFERNQHIYIYTYIYIFIGFPKEQRIEEVV